MAKLYDRIEQLCQERGITGGKMCNDLNISRSTITELRKGRVATLKLEKAGIIADYFGITVDELMGNEKKPTVQDSEIKDEFIAFYGEVKKDLDENDIADLKTFMRMKAEIKRKSEKK